MQSYLLFVFEYVHSVERFRYSHWGRSLKQSQIPELQLWAIVTKGLGWDVTVAEDMTSSGEKKENKYRGKLYFAPANV